MGVMLIAIKKMAKKCFEGETTMPKVNFWMIGIICLLAGIVTGLLAAPATHGIIIGSNSGNVRDSNNCLGDKKAGVKKSRR